MVLRTIITKAKSAWAMFKAFGEKVASVVNFILLIPVYFIGVGLTKFLAKISRAEVLAIHQNKESKTYWKDYDCKTEEKEKYKRMF